MWRVDKGKRGGVMIAMALFFAAIGILMGLGRLKSHEYQVMRRMDRTYQIEKKLATRSVTTAIRYAGGGRIADGANLVYFYPVFSNEYQSVNFNERLSCVAEPTKYIELQYNFTSNNWFGFPNISRLPPGPSTLGISSHKDGNVIDGFREFLDFKVDIPLSNAVYRGAIYQNTLDSWLNNDRGYLYQLCAKDHDGAGKTRLYLIGNDSTSTFRAGEDYSNQLERLPWIMLEQEKNGSGATAFNTLNLHIQGNTSGELVTEYHDIGVEFNGLSGGVDSGHPFGLLLSKNYMVAYTCNAADNLHFSTKRYDLSEVINTNDFRNVWVLIEHEFDPVPETVQPMPEKFYQKLVSFFIKEPTTHSITVVNRKIADTVLINTQVMTWLFQTEYPDGGRPGKQCLLDTFGGEPTSLKKERRGELKR